MDGLRILVTNDDGYDAPGIDAAYRAMASLGRVFVVAPITERSACSHMITHRTPITVTHRPHPTFGEVFAVDGTPADCVRLAQAELIDGPIDLVVSGINMGANAGVDVFYSGTVAAAREGAILGIRSIALSQAIRAGVDTDWLSTSETANVLVRQLLNETLPGPGFFSVNFPAPIPQDFRDRIRHVPVATGPPPLAFKRVSENKQSVVDYQYSAPYWMRDESDTNDYTVIRDGGVAVTAIPLHGRF